MRAAKGLKSKQKHARGQILRQDEEKAAAVEVKVSSDEVAEFVKPTNRDGYLAIGCLMNIKAGTLWGRMINEHAGSGVAHMFHKYQYAPLLRAIKTVMSVGVEYLDTIDQPGNRNRFRRCPRCIAEQGDWLGDKAPWMYEFHTTEIDLELDDNYRSYLACSECDYVCRVKDVERDPRTDRLKLWVSVNHVTGTNPRGRGKVSEKKVEAKAFK